jgi:hypothetical protein
LEGHAACKDWLRKHTKFYSESCNEDEIKLDLEK